MEFHIAAASEAFILLFHIAAAFCYGKILKTNEAILLHST